jgi:hypothetical protein
MLEVSQMTVVDALISNINLSIFKNIHNITKRSELPKIFI